MNKLYKNKWEDIKKTPKHFQVGKEKEKLT